MVGRSTGATAPEAELVTAARDGDEDAFGQLIEPYRGELHAQCYRMLGSVHDADDALQDTLLRAWRGLAGFAGRSSVRTWLHTIATNASLDLIGRRPKRVLPMDYGPAADPHLPPGAPVAESVWIEPYADSRLGHPDRSGAPDARYDLREGVELAFVAALQHLPATQRAVLILREALGFSAKEVAEALETTTASVNSALQRARASVDERVPEQSQQATLRALGDDAVSDLVSRYVDAWERCDVEAFVAMLAKDATFTMPPLATWYEGRASIAAWATNSSLSGDWRWRALPTSANAQPALAFYAWDPTEATYLPFALNILSFRGDRIANVTAFITRSAARPETDVEGRWPEQPADPRLLFAAFGRFGLPDRLD
jgi:RNA polymerase sigma-70 factor, ECF subfamily